MEHRARIVAVALLSLGIAVDSEALTLGRIRGAVLIGQPLDLVVPVQTAAGEDASSLCFDADVFHADTRQDASRVRVVVEPGAQPQLLSLRVLSSAVVDEPVVSVYLRSGCGQKTTRRYVLLADLPSEVAAPAVPLVVPAQAQARAPAKPAMRPVVPAAVVQAKTLPETKPTARRGVDDGRPDVQAAVAAPKSGVVNEKGRAGRSAGQSRLKLDPLDLFSDRVANLDSHMTFAPPEDALRQMQKVQTLQGDVKALLALVAKNDASLADLRARVQTAEAARVPGGWLFGLIALVLACLTAAALIWRRQRRAQAGGDDWWSGSIATAAPTAAETHPVPPPEPLAARQQLNKVPVSGKPDAARLPGFLGESGLSSGVNVSLTEMSDSNFDDFMLAGGAQGVGRTPPPSSAPAAALPTRSVHDLHSEAISAIRQQAKLFVSLGQTERAVHLLKTQIHDSDEANPWVCLDLLSMFHALGMKTDFQQWREQFNRLFNGRVAEFAFFKAEGRDLEFYPDVLSRITALWPDPKVLDVMASCIFPDAGGARRPSFDLAAFRDLLLLHAVAQRVVSVAHSNGGNPSVPGRSAPVSPDSPRDEIQLSRVLDIDLSTPDWEGPESTAASAAEVDFPLIMPGDDEFDAQGADRPLHP